MSKIKCCECGLEFGSDHNECPNCGCPVSQPDKTRLSAAGNGPTAGIPPYFPQQMPQQMPLPPNMGRHYSAFEIICYVFAGISAVLYILTFFNYQMSNIALRHEIAAFSWLIVGRITALVNK